MPAEGAEVLSLSPGIGSVPTTGGFLNKDQDCIERQVEIVFRIGLPYSQVFVVSLRERGQHALCGVPCGR